MIQTLQWKKIVASQATQRELKQAEFLKLLKNRQHELICTKDGFKAKLTVQIYCPIHGFEHTTTVTNYKKAKTGMPCCGRQLQSEKGTWEHVNKKRNQQNVRCPLRDSPKVQQRGSRSSPTVRPQGATQNKRIILTNFCLSLSLLR